MILLFHAKKLAGFKIITENGQSEFQFKLTDERDNSVHITMDEDTYRKLRDSVE